MIPAEGQTTGGPGPGLLPAAGRTAVAGLGPVTRLVLSNGLTVLVRENRAVPVVALTLLSRVGAANEAPERNGVTALLGRVLLKGTRARSAVEVASAAEDAGGGIESGADQEYAEVRTWGLARHWRRLLALLHEVVTEPRLADEEIERERQVLLAQIRGLEDQPAQVANRILARGLFGPRGYGLPPSGEEGTVARIVRADLARSLRAGVRDGSARPGRLRRGRRRRGARRGGAALRWAPGRRAPAGRAAPAGPAGPAPPGGDVANPAGARPARLSRPDGRRPGSRRAQGGERDPRRRDVEPALPDPPGRGGPRVLRGLVYPTRRGAGRIVLHIGTAPENVEAAEAGLRREVARLDGEPVPEDELRRTKAYLSGSFVLDRRTNGRQSFYLAFYEVMGVGAEYVMHYPSLLEAVGETDVLQAARRHLVEPAVVVVGPA